MYIFIHNNDDTDLQFVGIVIKKEPQFTKFAFACNFSKLHLK